MVAIRGHAGRWGAYAALGIAATLLGGHVHGQPNGKAVARESSAPAYRAPVARPVTPPRISVYQPRCQTPQSREDAEFCEERKAANAEDKSAHWAGWQFWVSLVGVVFIVGTLIFTRNAAAAAAKAAGVAEKALTDLETPFMYPDIVRSSIVGEFKAPERYINAPNRGPLYNQRKRLHGTVRQWWRFWPRDGRKD